MNSISVILIDILLVLVDFTIKSNERIRRIVCSSFYSKHTDIPIYLSLKRRYQMGYQ